jgi:VWFA-related protein
MVRGLAALVAASVLAITGGIESQTPESGLVEHARRTLAQVDVSVTGPRQQVEGLDVADFELFVGGERVELLAVDRLCPTTVDGSAKTTDARVTAGAVSFLFYFDPPHLTLSGRQNAIDLARSLVRDLVRGGNRASIVSAGRKLWSTPGFTENAAELLDSLDRLASDRDQSDEYASLEQNRQREVARALRIGSDAACAQARLFQREELSRTESALSTFSAMLARFAEVDSPKVAIYFADTIRLDAGKHYLTIAGGRCRSLYFDARGSFERVWAKAGALNVRAYAVQGEGLVTRAPGWYETLRTSDNGPGDALRDAQSGLKALTLETGGDAFLNGGSPKRIAERIRADSSCTYLLSFDPAVYPEDEVLSVRVELLRRKARVSARSRIVFESDSARTTSHLLAAFLEPSAQGRVALEGSLVPLAFEDGRYRALVQITIPASSLPAAWDVGATAVRGGGVGDEVSARIVVDSAGTRAVLEEEMTFRPGPFEIVCVARDSRSGEIGSTRVQGVWPEPDRVPVFSQLGLLQPANSVFVRAGVVRKDGSLSVPRTRPVRPDLPVMVYGLVCRSSKTRAPLTVTRKLRGENTIDLPPLTVDLGGDRPCAPIVDSIPAGRLATGRVSYGAQVDGTDVRTTLDFVVENAR